MKNTILKLSVIGTIALVALFAGANPVSAQYAVPTCNSATLHGLVTPNGATTLAWFEWGPTSNMGYATSPQTFTSDSAFESAITGLSESTTYYFRAVASNANGKANGSTVSFTTSSCNTSTPTPSPSPSPSPSPTPTPNPVGTSCYDGANVNISGPSTISAGQTGSFTATATNSGNDWWYHGSAYQLLQTSNLSISPTYGHLPNRVAPGESVSWTFNVTAPSNPGSYSLNMRMMHYAGWDYLMTDSSKCGTGPSGNQSFGSNGQAFFTVAGGSTPPPPPPPANVTVDITADQTNLSSNGSTTIRWSSTNATSCNASNGTNGWSGSKSISGSFYTGILNNDQVYSITCTNGNGGSASDSVSVTVNNTTNNNVSVDLRADDTNIDDGDATTLRWSSSNADYCTASGGTNGWSGSRNTSGTFYTGDLDRDETYFISCTNNNGGSASDSVSVNVDDNNNNDNGDEPDVTTRSATNISESYATLQGRVDGNGSSGRAWFEWGTDRDLDKETDDRSVSSGTTDFSTRITNLRSDTTYYFRAVAENDDGTDYGSILSFRTDDNGDNDNNNNSNLTAVTTPATYIGTTSAQLNSLILNSDGAANTWFEWGTSTNLGYTTSQNYIGSQPSVTNATTITGLVPGVTYYFRAVAQNSSWRNNGSILTFTTARNTTTYVPPPTTVYRNTTTVVNSGTGSNSLVLLTIDGGSQFITVNERREYHVTWKNISNETLHNVVVRVLLPKTMIFEATSKGSFSNSENTLAYNIDILHPGEMGDLSLVANTNGAILQPGELVVVVANLVYTTPTNLQGDALAYMTHTAYIGGSVLGASVFLAGWLPTSLFGWLLLLILLLILILLGKYLLDDTRRANTETRIIEHH